MNNTKVLLTLTIVFFVILSGCAKNLSIPTTVTLEGDKIGLESSTREEDSTESEEEPSDISIIDTPDRLDFRLTQTPPPGLERVETTESEPVTGEVPIKILNDILADLSECTGAKADKIKIIRSEAVVWNDGSLGCPKPGEFYIQMMINGYWVVLEVEGVEYDYRVSDKGSFKLCEGNNTPPNTSTTADEQTINPLVAQAKADLADRLKVSTDQIELLKVVQAKWPYDSIGCLLPNGVNIDTSTPGYQILLNANDEQYMYHTDGKDWVVPCTVKPPNEIRTLP